MSGTQYPGRSTVIYAAVFQVGERQVVAAIRSLTINGAMTVILGQAATYFLRDAIGLDSERLRYIRDCVSNQQKASNLSQVIRNC
jgi:hypothetical protein